MADKTQLYTRQPNGRLAYFSAGPGRFNAGDVSAEALDQLANGGFHEVDPEIFARQRRGYEQNMPGTPAPSPYIPKGNAAAHPVATLPPGASRVANRSIDGTTPYFHATDGYMEEGRLPAGEDPQQLAEQGYVFADAPAFTEARTRLDPMRPPQDKGADAERQSAEDMAVDALAQEMDRPYPKGENSAEDVDALASSFDADMAPRAQPRRAPSGPRRPIYDVQNVPSSVAMASPLGGAPLPSPSGGLARALDARHENGAPVSVETLADVQDRASRQRGLAMFERGGARMGAALAGIRPDSGAADDLGQGADRQVSEYLQRKQGAEAEKQKAEQDALKSPGSPQSKRFQDVVSRTLPGIYTPEQIAQMTAADKETIFDAGKMRAQLDERTKQAADDRTSRETIATDNRDARKEDTRQRSLDRQLSRDLATQQHKDSVAQREGQKQEDFSRKMSERNVGGYTFDPANPPSVDGAKQMAHITTARDEVNAGLDNLEQKIRENGSEMFGTTAGDMASNWMNITNRLRNLNQMGVPNGKDYEMLAKQLVDPTSMAAMTTSNARMLQQIRTLRRQMGQTVDATAKSYKFTPAGGQQAAPPSGDMVTIIPPPAPDGTPRSPKHVPRGEAQRYIEAGARLADG